jgi:hypothetical protein
VDSTQAFVMTSRKSIYRHVCRIRFLWLLVFMLTFFLPRVAAAQCSSAAPLGFQNISPEPGNPFQAEYAINITSPAPSSQNGPAYVARFAVRDSHGRVRVEHSRGKYQIQRSDGTQATEERTTIFICDPLSGTSIHLDSLNKTATIRRFNDSSAPGTAAASGSQSFCARMFEFRTRNHDAQTKDLGRRQISGFDAHGLRFWSPLRPDFDVTPSFTYTDTWCSDDLAAIVGLVVVSANGDHHREITLKKVIRKEPDPAQFQIPPGYIRMEREGSSPSRSNLN